MKIIKMFFVANFIVLLTLPSCGTTSKKEDTAQQYSGEKSIALVGTYCVKCHSNAKGLNACRHESRIQPRSQPIARVSL